MRNVSLLAGEGTGLGMTEAYVLAGELSRAGGDYAAAFRSHEQKLRPFIEGKQKSAENFASNFAPQSAWGVWPRNPVANLLTTPPLADFLIGPPYQTATPGIGVFAKMIYSRQWGV